VGWGRNHWEAGQIGRKSRFKVGLRFLIFGDIKRSLGSR
jgi:hypothetical protein